MPLTQVIHILIHIFDAVLVIGCIIIALLSYRTSPRIVITELMQVLDRMESRLDTQEGRWKKLNANYALLLAREKSNGASHDVDDDDDDGDLDTKLRSGEDLDDYKKRMRGLMSRGKLRHI